VKPLRQLLSEDHRSQWEGSEQLIQYNDYTTRWTTGVRFPVGAIFLFATTSRSALGPTKSPIQWLPWILSSGIKWPGREGDY